MDIATTQSGDQAQLRLKGRLDAYWADHVGRAVEQAIRGGAHHLQLNFSEVEYLSSAGIRILLQYYKSLKAIDGSLRLIEPNAMVEKVLTLSGFDALLLSSPPAAAGKSAASATARRIEKPWGTVEVREQGAGRRMSWQVLGSPEAFLSGSVQPPQSVPSSFPANTLGLGLGAFGTSFSDCQNRFGEFLAVGGAALAMPTDGSNVPDHMIANQDLVPELQVLYGIRAVGEFSHLLRFDRPGDPGSSVAVSDLAECACEIAGSETVCLTILAECGTLVGAALRRSPGLAGGANPLQFPGVRDWVSLTTERTTDRHVALITGLASKSPATALLPLLRPLAREGGLAGHFHAGIFPYRPLPRGELKLGESVRSLLETDSAQGLLHLLCDDRPYEALGQSELIRGACWLSAAVPT